MLIYFYRNVNELMGIFAIYPPDWGKYDTHGYSLDDCAGTHSAAEMMAVNLRAPPPSSPRHRISIHLFMHRSTKPSRLPPILLTHPPSYPSSHYRAMSFRLAERCQWPRAAQYPPLISPAPGTKRPGTPSSLSWVCFGPSALQTASRSGVELLPACRMSRATQINARGVDE